MKLIKFHIQKIKPENKRVGKYNIVDVFDFKTVGFIDYRKYKRKNWTLNSIEYFIFTRFYFFWKSLNISNKIAIISLIIGCIITIGLYLLDKLYFIN